MIKNIVPTLAEVGKIKIGRKGEVKRSKTGKDFRLPQKDDHFTITGLSRDRNDDFIPDKRIMATIAERTGQKPEQLTELPIRLLYDDPDLNFLTRLACFKGVSCWCSGDGENADRLDERTGEMKKVKCPCERQSPEYKGQDKCKATGVLSAVLEGVSVVGGVWKFRTTSYNSVVNILSSMSFIKSLTGGVLAGLPLHLVVSPKTVNIPGGGGVTTVFIVRVEYRGTVEALVEIGYKEAERRVTARIRMDDVENRVRLMLDAPMDAEEERDIADEFYPETASAAAVAETPAGGSFLDGDPVQADEPADADVSDTSADSVHDAEYREEAPANHVAEAQEVEKPAVPQTLF
jgi:hypothetical protein